MLLGPVFLLTSALKLPGELENVFYGMVLVGRGEPCVSEIHSSSIQARTGKSESGFCLVLNVGGLFLFI